MAHQLRLSVLIAGVLLSAVLLAPAAATAGSDACRPGVTDDTPRPLPPSLVDRAMRLFNLHAEPRDQVMRGTVVRCLDGHLLACNTGANLPCGKADTAHSLPQGIPWCRQHPDADFIPLYISGHDSIYHWRCQNGAPVAAGATEPIDSAGFIMQYWQPIQ